MITPLKFNGWNLKISPWKRRFRLWKPIIFRFQPLNFRGVNHPQEVNGMASGAWETLDFFGSGSGKFLNPEDAQLLLFSRPLYLHLPSETTQLCKQIIANIDTFTVYHEWLHCLWVFMQANIYHTN